MNYYNRVSRFDIELLNQSNYKIQKTCLNFYLIGKDLCDIVGGTILDIIDEDIMKRWMTLNTKINFS